MRQKIIYAIVVAVTIYTGAIYIDTQIRFLILFELLLPCVSMLILMIERRNIKVKLEKKQVVCLRGETAKEELVIENRTIFPLSAAEVIGEYEDRRTSLTSKSNHCCKLGTKGTIRLPLLYETSHCGIYWFRLKRVRCYDCLGIFTLGKRRTDQVRICVLPRIRGLDLAESELLFDAIFNDTNDQNGDNMEQYQIRTYQPGDPMHKVHWKLSAKSEELQIREFEPENQLLPDLILDFYYQEGTEQEKEQWDAFLEATAALLSYLYRTQNVIKMIWYDVLGHQNSFSIKEEQDIYEGLQRLLELSNSNMRKSSFKEEYPEQISGKKMVLDMDTNLYWRGRRVLCLSETMEAAMEAGY